MVRKYRTEIILGIIFFIIATLSFGLGYLAHMKTSRAPIILEIQPSEFEGRS